MNYDKLKNTNPSLNIVYFYDFSVFRDFSSQTKFNIKKTGNSIRYLRYLPSILQIILCYGSEI